jgi:DNA-binding CsgD family transcriptional regulator
MAIIAGAACEVGELDRAAATGDALMELAEDLGDRFFAQYAHRYRGVVGMYRSLPSAAKALSAARELAEHTHDDVSLGDVCHDQGSLALALGQDEQGCRILHQALGVAEAFVPITGARIRCLLSEAAIRRGELVEARSQLDEALALPLAGQLCLVTRVQARLARAKGDHHRASELAGEGLGSASRSGAQLLVVDFLELVAFLAVDAGRCTEAGRLLAAVTSERERLGYVRFVFDQADFEVAMRKIEVALGPSASAVARSEGALLSVDDAVDYARRRRGERGRPSVGWASLTPTERMVVELVVEALSNVEIGRRMFVSTATVKSHLNHVFNKLGVTNRRELARVARAMTI